MRLLSCLVTTSLLLAAEAGALRPKGPACPEGDGLYAVGCNQQYLECLEGEEIERSCPGGLYFDRLLARCERKSDNSLCNAEGRRTLNVRQKAVTIDCENVKDGDHALDRHFCSVNYYQCANGRSFMRKCPFNQVFSPRSKRCDYQANCLGNNGVKLHPAAAYSGPTYDHDNYEVTAYQVEEDGPEAPKGAKCATLGDGATISNLPCSPYFWQCSNGKLFRKTCPKGLIYVLSQNLCDYPNSVRGCPEFDGTETLYQPSYVAPTTTTTTAAPTTTQSVYAPPTEATTQYSPPAESSPEYSLPIYAPPPQAPQELPGKPEIVADCNNKGEGFFEIASCHRKFLSCSNGQGRVIECASDLVYDARVNACDFVDACRAPRTQKDLPELYNHGGALDTTPKEQKVDFDCSDKADGQYFKEACTHKYYFCNDRRAFAQECPADLVFNKATGTCDFAANCEKNYMEPTKVYTTEEPAREPVKYEPSTAEYAHHPPTEVYTRPTYTQKPTTTTTKAYEQPTTTTQAPYTQVYTTSIPPTRAQEQPSTTTQKPYTKAYTTQAYTTQAPPASDDFSCANLVDGNFASGICKHVFYTCSHGQLSATKCPAGLVYNPYRGQCDYSSNVPDCRGQDSLVQTSYTTTTEAPTTTTTAPYAPVYAPVFTTQAPPKYAAYCERLADGNYGKTCEAYFFQCANFETSLVKCPAGLFYNVNEDRCDIEENIKGCPGYIPTTPAPAASEAPSTKGYQQYTTRQYPNIDYTTTTPGPIDTTPIAETFSCRGRADGIYALPYCSRDYVQCINGRSLLASCASGLFYSEQTGLCDYKSNVAVCKHRHGADIIADDACVGKEDGYYSAGCSSHYFSCIDENIRKMECPNKLKFSQKMSLCDYPTDVEECGIAEQSTQAPPAVPSDFCTKRPGGLHSFAPCSPHYVVCDHAIAIAGTCAAPLVFNRANEMCDYKSNNKECGSEYVPTTTTASAGYYKEFAAKVYERPATTASSYVTVPTTKAYEQASTTTKAYETAPTTTTKAYEAPTTTTKAYEAPTTTTKAYEAPTTTTEAPTTTEAYTTTTKPYEVPTTTATTTTGAPTTTTPAEDVPSTTAPYQQPEEDVPTTAEPVEYTTSQEYLRAEMKDWTNY